MIHAKFSHLQGNHYDCPIFIYIQQICRKNRKCYNTAIMALSDKTILEQLERGDIVIEPFKRENLATSSYDVSLGEMYFREQKPKNTFLKLYKDREIEK